MRTGRAMSGEPLTLILIGVSILGGMALAIACSYRPIALWWVMVGCSAINLGRIGVQLSRESPANRPGATAAGSPLVLVARALAWSLDALAFSRSSTSKASIDRQHARFLVWFAEHNLLWTTIGFGASLLLWHRFGPTTPTLVVMAALMSCGLFAALGAAVGAKAPTLGLCWREPCRTPDLRSVGRIVHDVGCVVVLANRRDYAARCDWAKGGRFHELFLTVDDLARAGVEPGLEAVLAADDETTRRALARKERLDRALALTPVFAVGLLAAVFAIPPLAGSEPLPSLWTIVSRRADTDDRASANSDDIRRDLSPGAATSTDGRQAQNNQAQNKTSERSRPHSSPRADGDTASNSSQSDRERPDITGQGGESSNTGDAVASARGDGAGAAGEGAGAREGEAAGSGSGSAGSGGASSSGDARSGSSGGHGGGPRGYGTGGVAPQRAESPNALPAAPVNPGKAIEVVLPAFAPSRDDSADDDPTGTKRKGKAPDQGAAYQPRHDTTAAPKETTTREPVQRLPNWVFKLLHR